MYLQLESLIYDSFLFLIWIPAEALLNRNPQDFVVWIFSPLHTVAFIPQRRVPLKNSSSGSHWLSGYHYLVLSPKGEFPMERSLWVPLSEWLLLLYIILKRKFFAPLRPIKKILIVSADGRTDGPTNGRIYSKNFYVSKMSFYFIIIF